MDTTVTPESDGFVRFSLMIKHWNLRASTKSSDTNGRQTHGWGDMLLPRFKPAPNTPSHDALGHSLLAGPHTTRHDFLAAAYATLLRACGQHARYEKAPGPHANNPPGDPSKRIELRVFAGAPRGGDRWIDVTYRTTSSPSVIASCHNDIYTSSCTLASAEREKLLKYGNVIGLNDDLQGLAVSVHGQLGPNAIELTRAALDALSSSPESDPLSWTAPTARTQWHQALSIAFWRGSAIEYQHGINDYLRALDGYNRDRTPPPPAHGFHE